MEKVYRTSDDSLLMLRNMKGRVSGHVLDMGTGSGILAVAAALEQDVTRVTASDINPEAIKATKKKAIDASVQGRIDYIVGDLFDAHTGRRYDWILFNPPYLPSETCADEHSWAGGRTGAEVILRFLNEAPGYISSEGSIILIVSSLTDLLLHEINKMYYVEVLEELPLFFERLTCLLLRPL
jgi:release factor glutamine methyltransferase